MVTWMNEANYITAMSEAVWYRGCEILLLEPHLMGLNTSWCLLRRLGKVLAISFTNGLSCIFSSSITHSNRGIYLYKPETETKWTIDRSTASSIRHRKLCDNSARSHCLDTSRRSHSVTIEVRHLVFRGRTRPDLAEWPLGTRTRQWRGIRIDVRAF